MDTTVIALIAGGVPTALISVLGFFLRNGYSDFRDALAGLRTDVVVMRKEQTAALDEIKDTLAAQDKGAAVLDHRMTTAESDLKELAIKQAHDHKGLIQRFELLEQRLPRGRK